MDEIERLKKKEEALRPHLNTNKNDNTTVTPTPSLNNDEVEEKP